MTRLDHNRAVTQIAQKLDAPVTDVKQDDDLGQPLDDAVPRPVPLRGRRAATPTRPSATTSGSTARSSPPSPSAARPSSRLAARRRRRRRPTPPSTTSARGRSAPPTATGCRWAIPSDGSYGVPEGIISSFPVHAARDGEYEIVQGLDIDDYSRGKIDASAAELVDERDAVHDLGLIYALHPHRFVSPQPAIFAHVGDTNTGSRRDGVSSRRRGRRDASWRRRRG